MSFLLRQIKWTNQVCADGSLSGAPYALWIWNLWGPDIPCSALKPSRGTWSSNQANKSQAILKENVGKFEDQKNSKTGWKWKCSRTVIGIKNWMQHNNNLGCPSNKLQKSGHIFLAKCSNYIPEPLNNTGCSSVASVFGVGLQIINCKLNIKINKYTAHKFKVQTNTRKTTYNQFQEDH